MLTAGKAVCKFAILPSCPITIHLSVTTDNLHKQYSLSPDPAAGMDTTSIADFKPEEQPATAAANTLCIDNGTDEADRRTASTFPFFHLPREFRDEIYNLVAMDARTTYSRHRARSE